MLNRPELRWGIAQICLLLLGASLAASFPFRTLPQRLRQLSQRTSRAEGIDPSGFWFDPAYATFLEAVRRSTPERSTVAVIVPKTVDVYTYQAVYQLVPRRVVSEEEIGEASFVAVYREPVPLGLPAAVAVPGGFLVHR